MPSTLDVLPIELVLDILRFASASSQTTYRELLCVSRRFKRLVRLECLQVVPITLDRYGQLCSFEYLLRTARQIQPHVRYLWATGDGLPCWSMIQSILSMCPNIISLSCTSRSVVSLCAFATFQHTQLTELTLVEPGQHEWGRIMEADHAIRLCAQLTHLRLEQELLPGFPKEHFSHLTHLSFSSHPLKEDIEEHLTTVKSLAELRYLVITIWYLREATGDVMAKLLALDKRLSILHCQEDWTEAGVWQASIGGGLGLWELGKLKRKET